MSRAPGVSAQVDGSVAGEGRDAVEVVVIGGGVSGCACAAALACSGIRVTVVSSALDAVGQPGYGPEVSADGGGRRRITEVMDSLPPVLRAVWMDATVAWEQSGALLAVDRRMLSVETKRALEQVPGLRFRQGLVVGLTLIPADCCGGRARWSAETAFGERIEGDVVVIAVGLSLAGRVSVGGDVLPGGRYGETFGDGLAAACKGLGAGFAEAVVEVGRRVAGKRCRIGDGGGAESADLEDGVGQTWESLPGSGSERSGEDTEVGRAIPGPGGFRESTRTGQGAAGGARARLVRMECEQDRVSWGLDYPAAPYWVRALREGTVIGGRTEERWISSEILPDGLATGEVYVVPGDGRAPDGAPGPPGEADPGGAAPLEAGAMTRVIATRLGHVVRGVRIANLLEGGRLVAGDEETYPVWVTGRAGGAQGYLESLEAAMRVAEDIRGVVGAGRARGEVEAR